MVSESTGNYPSMVDDLDAGDMEGRTKMAFAKMQTPVELKESYVFDDADFDVQQDEEDGNLSSGENSLRQDDDSPDKETGNVSFELELESKVGKTSGSPLSRQSSASPKHQAKASPKEIPSMKARRRPFEEKEEESKKLSAEEEKFQKMTVEEKAAALGLYS